MTKKILISIGSIASVAIPTAVSVSCSTTWTNWSKKDDGQTKTIFPKSKIANIKLWKIRDNSELMSAWDSTKKELDLSKINNQYELAKIISNILKMSSPQRIDSYWNDFDSMKTYLSSIESKVDITVIYKEKRQTISWDIISLLAKAIKGIDDYKLLATQTEKDAAKKFNVELKGIKNNQPIQMTEVAKVGAPLLSNKIVSELMEYNNGFALSLSKLVNLPKDTFDEFSHLIDNLDTLLDDMWTFIKTTSFIKDKELNFEIGPTGHFATFDELKRYNENLDLYNELQVTPPANLKESKIEEFRVGLIKAQFIIMSLKP